MYTSIYLLYSFIIIKSIKVGIKLTHYIIIQTSLFLHISFKVKYSTKPTNIFASSYNTGMTVSPKLMYYYLKMIKKFETYNYVIAVNDSTQGCVECPCMYVNLRKQNVELK